MTTLKFDLDVLASTCIRRKKPWPKLAIVGESVFLLDRQRISVLYMKSGKTKRKITKIQPLLKHTVLMASSSSGEFIGGLLDSGDLFLWHKTTDTLKNINGLPLLVNPASGLQNLGRLPYLCLAGSGSLLLVVTEKYDIFVWELDANSSFFTAKQPTIPGTWAHVLPERGSLLPNSNNPDFSVHAVFSINSGTLGLHCVCTFVFSNNGNLCITTATMQWRNGEPVPTSGKPTFSVHWKTLSIQLSTICPVVEPVVEPGAIVARHSGDGQLLAVAVNQLNSQANRIAFVSGLTEVVSAVDLKAMGTKFPVTKNARLYWIADMEWSHDDLFLICMTGQGSVCLLPRLGEPVLLQTHGFNVNMGPKFFLPLHPLVLVESETEAAPAKNLNPMSQRFSLAVHPKLPLFLFSDGFMVTAVEMSQDITCLTLMRRLASLSTSHFQYVRSQQRLHLSLFQAFDPTKNPSATVQGPHWNARRRRGLAAGVSPKRRTPYKFESTPTDALEGTLELESPGIGFEASPDYGRIVFGDEGNVAASADFVNLMDEDGLTAGDYLILLQKELILAWGLAASHVGLWTVEHEETLNAIAQNLVKTCAVLLESVDSASVTASDRKGSAQLTRVLSFLKQVSSVSCMDALGKKLMVCYVRFVHSTVELLLRSKALKRSRVHTLNGCYLILRYVEHQLGRVYVLVEGGLGVVDVVSSLARGGAVVQTDEQGVDGLSVEEIRAARAIQKSQCPTAQNCWKRLAGSWRLLYKYVVRHYDFVRHQYEATSVPRKSVSIQLKLTTEVMLAVLCRIQRQNADSPFHRSLHLPPAETLSVEGHSSQAIASWLQSILSRPDEMDSSRFARSLHGVLYTLLLCSDLRSAMELIELLVRQPPVARAIDLYVKNGPGKISALTRLPKSGDRQSMVILPRLLTESRAVQLVMQSLGRVMASYFTNLTLFVFPPHHPLRIPKLHSTDHIDDRVITLRHDVFTQAVTSQQLSHAWTPEKCLQYLLLGGQVPDAIWMVYSLGDWKTAFVMSTAVSHHLSHTTNESTRRKLTMPNSLQLDVILKKHVMSVIEELSAKEHLPFDANSLMLSLTDILLAATVARVDVTCVVLTFLVQSLLDVVKQFDALIPDGVYLPAPPVYCPQPVLTEEERARHLDVELIELRLRRRVSVIVSLIVLVMGSSRVARPAAQWYASKVLKACAQRIKLEGGPGETDIARLLQGYVSSKSMFNRDEENPSVRSVLSCFRDVASVLWMLDARDKLSLLLRQKRTEKEKLINDDTSSSQGRKWKSLCKDALNLAIHLLPFRKLLNVERQIHNVVLSLILEMPSDAHTAQTLAEHFSNPQELDPEIQDRLKSILKDWQACFLSGDGQSGTTMNLVYCDASADADRNAERKRAIFRGYDELVFRGTESSLEIGSRPFESCVEFTQFLELYYDVCLGRTVEEARLAKRRWPLLGEYSAEVRKRELNSLPKKVLSRATSEIISVEKPFQSQQPVPSAKRTLNEVKMLVEVPKLHQRRIGLFRSLSTGDVTRRSEGVLTRSSSVVSIASRVSERDFPAELDVLAPSDAASEISVSLLKKAPRPSSGNRNNNSSNVKQTARDIKRATSLIEQTGSHRELEALSAPLVPSWMLERMNFGEGFGELERLTEWLSQWAGRTSAFSDSSVLGVTTLGAQRPAIMVRVTPKLLMYSLWLVDNFGEMRPKSLEPVESEITVAMVREVGSSPPSRKNSRTGSTRSERGILTETIEEEVSEEWEDEREEEKLVETVTATPVAPVPRERNRNLRRGSRDDELDEMAAFNESFRDGERGKRKGRKKSEELKVDPNDKIFDKDSEQTVISYDIVVNEFESRRFSIEKPEEVRAVQENFTSAERLRTDSESSIAISSLTGEDLRQTMKDTLISLTGNKNTAVYDEREDDVADGQGRHSPQRASSAPLQHATYNEQPLHSGQPVTGDVQPDLTTELQRVVRDEMRRIMAAQQKGILAMLSSLDPTDDSYKIPPSADRHGTTIPNGNTPMMNGYAGAISNGNPPRMTNTGIPNGNPPRMNGHVPNGNPQSINRHYNPQGIPPQYAVYTLQADTHPTLEKFSGQSTDESITPILSDSKLDDWNEEKPLKKPCAPQRDFQNPVVRDALRELGQLRGESETRPLLFAPAPYGPPSNRVGLSNANASNANRGKPFSDLMEALREMNGKMFPLLRPPSASTANLIRLPPPEKQFRFPMMFSNIPTKSVDAKEPPLPVNHLSSVTPSPLLQRNYFIREPPDRDPMTLPPTVAWNDTGVQPPPPFFRGMPAFPHGSSTAVRPAMPVFRGGAPFPLLRLPDMSRVVVRPFFLPRPGFQVERPQGANQFPQDQMEPFGPMQDAVPTEGTNKRERGSPKSHEIGEASTKVEVAEGKHEEEMEEEEKEPVRLHAGYALTPGMFDEYLAHQDELGSAADTNAKLQYQAAMALQSKPKELGVLKKDMYTEVDEEELRGSDPVADAIEKYRQNRFIQRYGPQLPPDVFMKLRFADSDAGQATDALQGTDGARSYLNVVDIDPETLADIVSSVRDRQSRPAVAVETGSSSTSRALSASPSRVPKENTALKVPTESLSSASGPDAVTYNLFNKKADVTEMRVSPGKLKKGSKTTMDGMNQRMNEIARMAQNMQRDFETTRLVVSKLEDVGNRVLDENERREIAEARMSSERQIECDDEFIGGNTTQLRFTNFSNVTADDLLERALDTTRRGADVTRDDLQELFQALSPRRPEQEKAKEEDEKRRNLLEWMEKKKMERMKRHKDEMDERRGSEVHPYAPKANQKTLTRKDWESMDEDRTAKRKKLQLANMELRTQEAAGLLNDMLSDRPDLSKPSINRPIRTADATLSCYHPHAFDTSRTSKGAPRSAGKSKFQTDDYGEYLRLLESCEREAEMILKGGSVVEVTARREERQSPERRFDAGREDGRAKAADRTYQLKSFRNVVKLQRPEVTRQSRPLVVKRANSVQDNRSATARQREMSLEEKQRIYGSTHIPGSARQRPTNRSVKSYTQRLQEMKQSPGKENEIHWRYQTGSAPGNQPQSASARSDQRTTPKPRETLQQFQPSKERRDSKSASATLRSPGLRWHKPAHRPKTYTEQLQKLQRPATVHLERMRPATTRLLPPQQRLFEKSVGPGPRSQRRSRPYADPYSDVDASSDLSSWSMDENVRKILYGDRSPLPTASDTELSELMAIRDGETPLGYTELVNIEDLEMIDGVSINSCLDWEEIDRIVANID